MMMLQFFYLDFYSLLYVNEMSLQDMDPMTSTIEYQCTTAGTTLSYYLK